MFFTDNGSDGDSDSEDSFIRRSQNKVMCPLSDSSENDCSHDDKNDIQNVRENMGQNGQIGYLRTCTENPGVKQIPSDSTNVSEVVELFFGDNVFKILY